MSEVWLIVLGAALLIVSALFILASLIILALLRHNALRLPKTEDSSFRSAQAAQAPCTRDKEEEI